MGQQWSIDDAGPGMLFDVEAAVRLDRIINSFSYNLGHDEAAIRSAAAIV